jgi:hypothetical protein
LLGGCEPYPGADDDARAADARLGDVAVVVDGANVSIAAPFDSGLDFVELLDLGGGMPTRVNIPNKRLPDALVKIKQALGRGR